MHTKQSLSFFFRSSNRKAVFRLNLKWIVNEEVSRWALTTCVSIVRKERRRWEKSDYSSAIGKWPRQEVTSRGGSRYVCRSIRATDRWTVTLTLRRFKGSKRVKRKEEGGGVRIVTMVTMTSLEACALCLNGSFVCVEVKANSGLETTGGGALWNLTDRNLALSAAEDVQENEALLFLSWRSLHSSASCRGRLL